MKADRQAIRAVITERGWRPGTYLENQVALFLSGNHRLPRPEQQHRAGRFRLDFAWPQVLVALEADGWFHRSPEGASKDRERDAWLRSQGWVVFRVDDQFGEEVLRHQLMRVSRLVIAELDSDWKPSMPMRGCHGATSCVSLE